MTAKTHTLGLIFTKDFSHVLLMHKNRPDWQKGKVNAVGGKIEEGEASINGMIREVWEETGAKTKVEDWVLFGELTSSEWNIDMYALHHQGKPEDFQTTTDEAF